MKSLFRLITYILVPTIIFSCKEHEYGKGFDIDFPVPEITSVSENTLVGGEITIRGNNFFKTNTLYLDGIAMKIVSQTETEIKAILPRIFQPAPLVLQNVYSMRNLNEFVITPIYPNADEIKVTEWPAKVVKNRAVIIRGENVDLIKEVIIGDAIIKVNGLEQQPNQLVVLAPAQIDSEQVQIQVKTMYGNVLESPMLPVEEPSDIFDPVDPIVLLDFEDGLTHFYKGDIPEANFTAQINRAGIIPARGQKFFSMYADNIGSMWDFLGSIKLNFETPLNLAEFNDPHISFLYNSADNVAYFQTKVVQDGKTGGSNFANNVTGNPLDAWTLHPTKGEWHWVSARLVDLLKENWGGDFVKFNPNGQIEEIELIFKQINGVYFNGSNTESSNGEINKKFRLNLDQVMITDGPVKPEYLLNDFEKGVSNFEKEPSDGQVADVARIANNFVPTISGNNYFSVIKENSQGWKWLGTLEFKNDYDLSRLADPYLCFLANTNGQKANLQFKLIQDGIAYGGSINTSDWYFITKGWEMKKIRLKDIQWENWSGTTAKINLNAKFSEITIGFSSGNVDNAKYELHIDDIYISDGAMF